MCLIGVVCTLTEAIVSIVSNEVLCQLQTQGPQELPPKFSTPITNVKTIIKRCITKTFLTKPKRFYFTSSYVNSRRYNPELSENSLVKFPDQVSHFGNPLCNKPEGIPFQTKICTYMVFKFYLVVCITQNQTYTLEKRF